MSIRDKKQRLEQSIQEAARDFYKTRLVSLAVFGSVARDTATPQSDTDIYLIVRDLPNGRMARVREFEPVEDAIVENLGYDPVLSPVLKMPQEVSSGSPLLWDMIDFADILHDENDYLKNVLQKTKNRLNELGARRECRGSAWYWILKDDFTPGEVFEL